MVIELHITAFGHPLIRNPRASAQYHALHVVVCALICDCPLLQVHGPYEHGSGFPAMNGDSELEPFDPYTPPKFSTASTGLSVPNVFTSETGCVTMSSFESMSAFLSTEHWGLHGGAPPDTCSNGGSGPAYVPVAV